MVFSDFTKQRILQLSSQGLKAADISKKLSEEGIRASRVGVHLFLKRYKATGTIARREGSGTQSKVTPGVRRLVDELMVKDDETSAKQIQSALANSGVDLSLSTILRCRASLGWTFRGSAYCQLIRMANKEKRLEWCRANQHDSFSDVIFSDECSVQMESHRRFACRRKGEKPRPKPRPKHPLKVHIWAGISSKGATGICIFEGKMNAPMYVDILGQTLLPFIKERFPNSHRFMQDNDPKHTSRLAQEFLRSNGINHWKTPPESPDLNPIENLWHELKEYIRREVKPHTKEELTSGIRQFWRTVDAAKCQKYIGHLQKVIPSVLEVNGEATGF